jgi:phosphoribosylformimino-5-aminoimidazole carboxamide ribotide isomerase
MILFPAIDLKDGQCVRLLRGDMAAATVFGDDPAAQARAFKAQGFDHLHIVDLNGAFEGRPVNEAAVAAILAASDASAQLGGGIRDLATIERWLDAGLARVILGTIALRAPEVVIEACRRHPGRIAVGIDARDGRVAVEGWAQTSNMTALDLARKFEDVGVAALIYTDIERDGAMAGPNIEATVRLAEAVRLPVIASGGVSSLDDLRALKQAGEAASGTIEGVICGRALYDGRIEPARALAVLRGATSC